MAHEDDEKPTGIDISRIGALEQNNGKKGKTARTSLDQIGRLTNSSVLVREALRSTGYFNSLAEATRASFVSPLRDKLDATSSFGSLQEKVYQDAMRDFATPPLTSHLFAGMEATTFANQLKGELQAWRDTRDLAFGGWPNEFLDSIAGSAMNAASRLVQDMREHSILTFQSIDIFADTRNALLTSSMFDFSRAVSVPDFGPAIGMAGIGRIGAAFETANAVHRLGLSPSFFDDFRSVTTLLEEQTALLRRVHEAAFGSVSGFDLARNLESMLARSIAAQEALLAEHRDAASDAKVESAFHRKLATVGVIINILMFLLSIALQLEERLTDGDPTVRANTEALLEMRDSFDTMATQLNALKESQQITTERQDDSDSEIAGILRDIARTLSEQAESASKDDNNETDQPASN